MEWPSTIPARSPSEASPALAPWSNNNGGIPPPDSLYSTGRARCPVFLYRYRKNPRGELPVVKMADGIAEIQRPPATITITTRPAFRAGAKLIGFNEIHGWHSRCSTGCDDENSRKKRQKFPGRSKNCRGAATDATGKNLPGRSRRMPRPATITVRAGRPCRPAMEFHERPGASKIMLPEAVLTPIPSARPAAPYVERTLGR